MIPFETALDLVLKKSYKLEKEQIEIQHALNRILAKDVISDIDMPPFDKSAMDGYACKREDLNETLEVIEIIPAGKTPQKKIEKNQCSKIMTGAMVPQGADCVIMVEQTLSIENNKIKFTGNHTNNNICYKSQDIVKNETLISRGNILKPQHIAVLASTGYAKPYVYKQPKVGILSTGNELVEPSEIPALSQIRNSNSYQLYAQTKLLNCIPNYYGIANDDQQSLHDFLIRSITDNDVTLLTGGVSMGDFDLVPEILEQLKVKIIFKKIAIQPGKPTVFGMLDNKFIFGLPGNPVSSFILFEMLVKPLLLKIMGYNYSIPDYKAPMGMDYERKKTERKAFIPVKLTEEGSVLPVEYHGSAHINSLCDADGIISVEIGKSQINKGEIVNVRLI